MIIIIYPKGLSLIYINPYAMRNFFKKSYWLIIILFSLVSAFIPSVKVPNIIYTSETDPNFSLKSMISTRPIWIITNIV